MKGSKDSCMSTRMSGETAGQFLRDLSDIEAGSGVEVIFNLGRDGRMVMEINFPDIQRRGVFYYSIMTGMLRKYQKFFPGIRASEK